MGDRKKPKEFNAQLSYEEKRKQQEEARIVASAVMADDALEGSTCSVNFERNRVARLIKHSKRVSASEKILMMLVVVGLAFMIYSAAIMYFSNCWVVSSIAFYYGAVQFALTFGVFIYNIKISRVELWTYKMIGIMNVLTACINLIIYYVVFQRSVLCSNAICHSNFTGQYIISKIPSQNSHCSAYDGQNSLVVSNSIYLLAEQALVDICSDPSQAPPCQPQIPDLYVFNQTSYFIGLMIVSFIFFLHGGLQLYHAINIDRLKDTLNHFRQFSMQIQEGDDPEVFIQKSMDA